MREPRLFLTTLLLISASPSWAKIDQDAHHEGAAVKTIPTTPEDAKNEPGSGAAYHKKLYVELFKQKRRDHLTAVQSILTVEEKKRKPFLDELHEKIRATLQDSRNVLEMANHEASAPFPFEREEIRDALARVVENVAFYSDFLLRFPNVYGKKYEKDQKLRTLLVWAFDYAFNTGLFDETTEKVVHLAAQQLGIEERQEDFVNPYDKQTIKEQIERDAIAKAKEAQEKRQKEKKAEKQKQKKGPSLAKSEF